MYRVAFAKMHASGNDFILIDNRLGQVTGDIPAFVRQVCRTRFSVGADGLILIESSEQADFRWRFFNKDGGEVEMCGNGARCVARFAYLRGICGRELSFETMAGIIKAEVNDGLVKVQLTKPTDYRPGINVELGRKPREASFINTGVPHVVYFVDDLNAVDVLGDGALTRHHEMFKPEGTNANFVHVLGGDRLAIRTYERGVEGETLACGTGAVAAALVAGGIGKASSPVRVATWGGNSLTVYYKWDGSEFSDVFLEGDAVLVFQGVIEEGALL